MDSQTAMDHVSTPVHSIHTCGQVLAILVIQPVIPVVALLHQNAYPVIHLHASPNTNACNVAPVVQLANTTHIIVRNARFVPQDVHSAHHLSALLVRMVIV